MKSSIGLALLTALAACVPSMAQENLIAPGPSGERPRLEGKVESLLSSPIELNDNRPLVPPPAPVSSMGLETDPNARSNDPNRLDFGGWFQTGYHSYNTGQFNNYDGRIQLHQSYFYMERQVDGSDGLDFGFRLDYLYGTDAPDTQTFGGLPDSWDNSWDNGGFYGHAIPQLYAQVAYDQFNVKIGHFYTIIGYEVVTAPNNFFYSHAFTMYNAEPFTHTGVLAEWNNEKDVSVMAGWTAGWDTGFDSNGGDNFIGGVSYDFNDDTSLTYATTFGNIGNGTDQSGYSHSIVFDRKLSDHTNYVLQSDLVDFNGTTDRRAIGVNQYLTHQINDWLAVGTRFEWWQTEVAPGNDADLFGWTVGCNIQPRDNLMIRPELRWDRDNDGVLIPTADNNRIGFGVDAIMTF